MTHTFDTYIRATPAEIWQALTNGDLTKQYFFATSTQSTWESGAPFDMRFGNGVVAISGQVIAAEPGVHLEQTWHIHYDPVVDAEPDSKVSWSITKAGKCCRLKLTHEFDTTSINGYNHVSDGWPIILSGMKTLLETGTPLQVDWSTI